jgi:hypothetical protein
MSHDSTSLMLAVGGATAIPIGWGIRSGTMTRIGHLAAILAAPGAPVIAATAVDPAGMYLRVHRS